MKIIEYSTSTYKGLVNTSWNFVKKSRKKENKYTAFKLYGLLMHLEFMTFIFVLALNNLWSVRYVTRLIKLLNIQVS